MHACFFSSIWGQTPRQYFKKASAFLAAAVVLGLTSYPRVGHAASDATLGDHQAQQMMAREAWTKAADMYQQLALENPEKEVHYLKKAANAFEQSGDSISALHLLEQALKLDDQDLDLVMSIALIQKDRGHYQAALEILMEYAQRFPKNVELRALALQSISLHYQNQIELAKERIEEDPQDVDAYSVMARTLVMAGESTAALGILTEGIIENPQSVDLWIQIGALEVGSGRDTEAASAYREAIRLDSSNGLARNNLAFLLVTTKDPALRDPVLALVHAQQALTTEPENPAFLNTLAEVFNVTGHHSRAVRAIKKAIAIAPDDPLYRRQLVRFQKAHDQFERMKQSSANAVIRP
ncbi:MAG: hypothetical protein CMH56_09510 [Myxococcales bacterium]|nr:hypothetical protein [Myxococcales bacterium]